MLGGPGYGGLSSFNDPREVAARLPRAKTGPDRAFLLRALAAGARTEALQRTRLRLLEAESAGTSGFHACLTKPVGVEALLATLDELFDTNDSA